MSTKTKTLLAISVILTSIMLFGCNTTLPSADSTPEQAPLPTPQVAFTPATAPIISIEENLPAGNCQLALDIPWERDENNPITDENRIMEILRALGDLEECLFTRQDGWLHHYVLRNGLRTENEVLVHLTEGGRSVDLRYNLFYDQGQFTANKYYDGRIPEDQWCNISDDVNKQVIQLKRNCETTEVYSLLTGNGKVDGYVEILAQNFSIFKKQPSSPGYYQPKAWFIQENDAHFFVIEIKYDMTNVQSGEDPSNKPFTDENRRHVIDLKSGSLSKYIEETSYKDGNFVVTTENVFLLFYTELPEDIAAVVRLDK